MSVCMFVRSKECLLQDPHQTLGNSLVGVFPSHPLFSFFFHLLVCRICLFCTSLVLCLCLCFYVMSFTPFPSLVFSFSLGFKYCMSVRKIWGQAGDFKYGLIWLKLCSIDLWVNSWRCFFFMCSSFWCLGAWSRVLARKTSCEIHKMNFIIVCRCFFTYFNRIRFREI